MHSSCPSQTFRKQVQRLKFICDIYIYVKLFLNAAHRIQGKTDLHCIIDPAHILRGKVSDKLQDTAFINGENLFCLNNGRLQAIFFYLTMRCLCYFLICLTCQSRDNQSRRVDVADIILKNDCWAGTVLFGANACLQFYKIDVSALELPIRFQVRASILICKSPLLFCSGLCSIHGGN